MTRRWLAGLLSTLAVLVLAAPVGAKTAPHVTVGIGENTSAIYDDPRFDATGIRHVRLIVPYDVVWVGGRPLATVDSWLREARRRGLEPLVTFAYSARRRLRWRVPSVRAFRDHVRYFRWRYPWVREYTTWNEANHKYQQPTGLEPVKTARLYRELRRQCAIAGCRVVAADVLLTGSRRTWRWLRAFRRAAGRGPHVWGIHNYPDANRFSTRLTRTFLRRVRGEVWFTETGGIVQFGDRWQRDELRAGWAVIHTFRLANLSPRITRLYIYNWRAGDWDDRWDSGLISPQGMARPGYQLLLDALKQERFSPLEGPLDRQRASGYQR